MSDEWNQNNQQTEWHNNDQQQNHDQHQDHGQQPEHQHFEPSHEPAIEPAPEATPSPELARLDAIEAAIHELRSHIDDLKASLPTPAATDVEAAPADEAEPAAEPVDPHADRLASIESEIHHIKALIGAVSHNMSDLHADVKSNAELHAETRGIVDEQHQLMRGLNYIITSAIGTLTASAKTIK